MIFDALSKQLLKLQQRLDELSIPFLLGGGMGLWLRDQYIGGSRQPGYSERPESRSTSDLDLLLSSKLIVDAESMAQLRDVLVEFGFQPEVKFMQFVRPVDVGGHTHEVKVDLLAAPPSSDEAKKVNLKMPRIRPKKVTKIHAYCTPEAAGILIEPVLLDVPTGPGADRTIAVQIPSSLNYLILKLHAFKDRREETEKNPDGGRHHAFDIFRIVTDMRQSDWDSVAKHRRMEADHDYLKVAAQIQRRFFSSESALGVLRLKDNQGYRDKRDVFDTYIPPMLDDLEELFDEVPDPSWDVQKAWGLASE